MRTTGGAPVVQRAAEPDRGGPVTLDASVDLIRKRKDYDDVGIDEVWFVDGRKRHVLVCGRPEAGHGFKDIELDEGSTLASPLLPGFEAPVSSLFEF